MAHAVGLSRGTYLVTDGAVIARLTFARGDVLSLAPSLDTRQDGVVTQRDLDQGFSDLAAALARGLVVTADGKPCEPHLEAASVTEQDGLELRARYECSRGARTVHVALPSLDDLPPGHRHIAHIEGAEKLDQVVSRGRESFEVPVPAGGPATATAIPGPTATPSATATATPPGAPERSGASWTQFLRMGVEHILSGYDHLLFLLGLVLVGGRARSIAVVITAFTLAHSITLALATLGVWAPSPRVVEPAIALSIAYVGVENFFVSSAEGRWRITFPFGLVHGFGFAGALREIGLPRSEVPEALVLFNVGVEVGQLAVLAVVLPVVYWLLRFAWFRRRGVELVSAAIAFAGVVWFVMRVRG